MINRDNYEEYFLLYVDNELSEAQRMVVENFVQQNPDLSGELEVLQQATLIADNETQFKAKESLYRNESEISFADYEEYFLLAVDNELTEKDKKIIESLLLNHPEFREQYRLLQATILPEEYVEFKDKSILYHPEEKERGIRTAFIRMSVAASVIGILATVFMVNKKFNPSLNTDAVARQEIATRPATKNIDIKQAKPVTSLAIAPLFRDSKDAEDIAGTKPYRTTRLKSSTVSVKQATQVKNIEANMLSKQDVVVVRPSTPSNEELIVPESAPNKNDPTIIDESVADKAVATLTSKPSAVSSNQQSIARTAMYKEIENEEEDNSIYIGAAEFNTAKLKGFLRKAVNFFDKKPSRNNSEKTVQIASFQIKSR